MIPLYLQICVQCGFGCLAALSLKGLLANVSQRYPKNMAFPAFAAQFIVITMLCTHLSWSILALFYCKTRMLFTDSAINIKLMLYIYQQMDAWYKQREMKQIFYVILYMICNRK